jgi:hypothetical protein
MKRYSERSEEQHHNSMGRAAVFSFSVFHNGTVIMMRFWAQTTILLSKP